MDRVWTDDEIAIWASGLRRFANQPLHGPFDLMRAVRELERAEPTIRITFLEVPDSQLPYSAAEAEPRSRKIKYRRSLMTRILDSDGEAIEIMLEEIGHVLLHPDQLTLNHFLGLDVRAKNIKAVERKEDEAEKFAWYVLAPIEEAYSVPDAGKLRSRFGLSAKGSLEYHNHIRSIRARTEKTFRQLPDNVVSFAEALRKKFGSSRGVAAAQRYPVRSDRPRRAPATTETPEQQLAHQMGYLPCKCAKCGNFSLRARGGCIVCELCGEEDGCE